jgi:hypothetical protein
MQCRSTLQKSFHKIDPRSLRQPLKTQLVGSGLCLTGFTLILSGLRREKENKQQLMGHVDTYHLVTLTLIA